MELTEKEKIVLETQLETLEIVREKVDVIDDGDLNPGVYLSELERDVNRIKNKLREPEVEPDRIDIIKPQHGPGDTVTYSINGDGRDILFTVMEVHHKTKEYKMKSKIARSMTTDKAITVMAPWTDVSEM